MKYTEKLNFEGEFANLNKRLSEDRWMPIHISIKGQKCFSYISCEGSLLLEYFSMPGDGIANYLLFVPYGDVVISEYMQQQNDYFIVDIEALLDAEFLFYDVIEYAIDSITVIDKGPLSVNEVLKILCDELDY